MAEGSSTGTEVPVSKAVTETEVRVSGADAGAVVPVQTAVTTVCDVIVGGRHCDHCRQGDEESTAINTRWRTRVSNVVGR